jgi:hypothetical protein
MRMLGQMIRDLDRCPHGRHVGDACAGWVGPGAFDGGCLSGRSLGNPFLQNAAPARIGTDVHGGAITLGDLGVAAGLEHRVEYGIRTPGGHVLRKPSGATEMEVRHAVRQKGDPLAHVVEIRSCSWAESVSVIVLPDDANVGAGT